jgi:hypothetical protein
MGVGLGWEWVTFVVQLMWFAAMALRDININGVQNISIPTPGRLFLKLMWIADHFRTAQYTTGVVASQHIT